MGAAEWLRRSWWRAFVMPLVVLALAAMPASALAAGTPTATVAAATNPTTTATSPTATTTSPTAASTATVGAQRDNRGLAIAALVFGFLSAAAVLFFVARDRDRTLDVYKKLVKSGAAVEVVNVPAQAGEAAVVRSAAEAELAAPPQVTIDGPSTVVVGASSEFVARLNGRQVVATWTAAPSTAIEPPAEPTSRLPVTARQSGPFTLTATAPDAAEGTVRVTAANPVTGSTRAQSLPFLGAGWGSVVVAIIIAAVTAALGLAGQLGGEAVATILGALVGYVVAKGQTESAPRAPSSAGASDAAGGGPGQGS